MSLLSRPPSWGANGRTIAPHIRPPKKIKRPLLITSSEIHRRWSAAAFAAVNCGSTSMGTRRDALLRTSARRLSGLFREFAGASVGPSPRYTAWGAPRRARGGCLPSRKRSARRRRTPPVAAGSCRRPARGSRRHDHTSRAVTEPQTAVRRSALGRPRRTYSHWRTPSRRRCRSRSSLAGTRAQHAPAAVVHRAGTGWVRTRQPA